MNNLRKRIVFLFAAVLSVFAFSFGVAAQEGGLGGLSLEDEDAFANALMSSVMSAGDLAYTFTNTAEIMVEGDTIMMDVSGDGVITADGFTMNVTGEVSPGEGETLPAQLSIIAVGESLFFDIGDGWVEATGSDLEDTAGMAGVDPGLLDDPTSALPMEQLGPLAEVDPTQFIQISRDGDTFTTNLLLEEVFADTTVQEVLMDNPDTAQVAMMAPMVLAGSEFQITQSLNDAGNVGQAMVDITAGSAEMGFDVVFNLTVDLAYGEGGTIEAPADAMPFEDFLNAMMGM